MAMNKLVATATLPLQLRITSTWILITLGLFGCYKKDNYMYDTDSPISPETNTHQRTHNVSDSPTPPEKTNPPIIDDHRSPLRPLQNSDAQVSPTIENSIKLRKLKQHRAWSDPEIADKEGLVTLEEFLESKGEQLNCWFTLEDRYGNADQPSTLMAADIVSGGVQTIDDLVTQLRNECRGCPSKRQHHCHSPHRISPRHCGQLCNQQERDNLAYGKALRPCKCVA